MCFDKSSILRLAKLSGEVGELPGALLLTIATASLASCPVSPLTELSQSFIRKEVVRLLHLFSTTYNNYDRFNVSLSFPF